MEKTNYKPFDLEKAKAGAKLMTKDGRPARIICTDRKGLYYNVLALVENESGIEYTFTFTNEGKCYNGLDNNCDLVMCPEKHEGWANVNRYNAHTYIGEIYDTQEEAIREGERCGGYIATIKVDWEE